ncbi:hypothetical protein, partial [Allorhizocola rhizosphaerae]|uniref:hypothetical protein n=1 Tax=Allorhizocola rhizosphaerae TaxID=1872709 RepID=UPI000E3BCD78
MVRLILGTLAARRGEVVALALLAVLAVGAATAAPLMADEARRRAIAVELDAATPAERAITASSSSGTLDELHGRVRRLDPPAALTVVIGAWTRPSDSDLPIVYRSGVCAHLRLVQGDCSGLVAPADAATPPGLRVTGRYDPAHGLNDPFWAGRAELTPSPVRDDNPLFTESTLDTEGLNLTVDVVAGKGSLTPKSIDAVTAFATRYRLETQVSTDNGLLTLTRRVAAGTDDTAALVAGGQLVVLCWLVLLLSVVHLARHRRTEVALGALRGAPRRHRAVLALGPTALVLIASGPIGAALAWLGTSVVIGRWEPLPESALLVAGAVLLSAVVSAALAEQRAHAVSLLEAMREVPSRRGRAGALAVEAAVVALAVAAIAQSTSDPDSGLAVIVPLCLAAVVGVLLARLVPLVAAKLGVAWIRRARLGSGLSVLWLARRPGADRLVALIVIAVGLLVHAAGAWDAMRTDFAERAAQELGAHRVLTVQARSRAALLHAVRSVDTQGMWAMAVARHQDAVAVDSPRLAAIVPDSSEIADRLRPAANEPIRINTADLELDVIVTGPMPPVRVTAVLDGPNGERVTGAVDVETTGFYRIAVPACAGGGCRLAWLSFPRSPDQLAISRVGPLSAGAVAHAARWRREVGMEPEVMISATREGYLKMQYIPIDLRNVSTDIRIAAADAPMPVPIVIHGPRRLAESREKVSRWVLTGSRPVDATAAQRLPGVPEGGFLVDLEYADRLSDSELNLLRLEVWLNRSAPSDAADRLRAAGVVIAGDETIAQRAQRFSAGGAGLGQVLRVAGGLAGIALAAVALL